MKLFIKILLFVFVAFVTNVKVASATITFSNIQETTTSFSFQNETPKTIYKVIENDLANCCQNGNDLVDYRNRGERLEANAAKTSTSVIKGFTKHATNQAIERGFKTPPPCQMITKKQLVILDFSVSVKI